MLFELKQKLKVQLKFDEKSFEKKVRVGCELTKLKLKNNFIYGKIQESAQVRKSARRGNDEPVRATSVSEVKRGGHLVCSRESNQAPQIPEEGVRLGTTEFINELILIRSPSTASSEVRRRQHCRR